MPLYDSKCNKCGKIHSYKASLADIDIKLPICCDETTQRVLLGAPLSAMADVKPWLSKKFAHLY